MLERVWALVIKEFIAVWQDRRSRRSLLAPPFIQFFIFAFAATLDVHNISIGILNNDYGKQSYEFEQRIKGAPDFTKIVYIDGEQELRDAINTEKVLAAVRINEDFSKKILSGQTGEIMVIADGRKSNTSQIATGYIIDIVERYNQDLALEANVKPTKTELKPRYWYNPNLDYTWFTVTGLVGTLSMLTSLSVTSLSISREKEMGTFEQLLVSPLSSWMILMGKAIPAIVIGVFEGSMMLLAGHFFLSLPMRGNFFLFYPSMLVFILAIVGIGLFISSLAKTQQQSLLGMFLMISPIIIMSGFATPIENMPVWLQDFALLNPLKYFLIIARGICMKDISAAIVFDNTWPMLLIAFGTLSIASWFFRTRIG